MRSREVAWLLLGAAALSGCHSCRERLPKAKVHAPADASAAASASPPVTAFTRACAKEAEKNHAAFKKAGTRETDDPGRVIQCDSDLFDLCVPDNETCGWTVALNDDVKINGSDYFNDCDFTWSLLYLDIEKGIRLTSKSFRGEATFSHEGPKKMIALGPATLFLLREKTNGATTIPAFLDEGAIYVVKDGKLATDPRFQGNLLDAVDIDGDGKLDIVLESPFVISRFGQLGQNVTSITMGPTPIAHRIDEGYSFDDDWAKKRVRDECPAPEANLDDDADVDKWLTCARFWNVPAAQIAKELGKRCKVYSNTGTFDQTMPMPGHDAGECPDYLEDWMKLEVPWTLQKKP